MAIGVVFAIILNLRFEKDAQEKQSNCYKRKEEQYEKRTRLSEKHDCRL